MPYIAPFDLQRDIVQRRSAGSGVGFAQPFDGDHD
jgi:hypothetical protein